jgi:histidinol-phosphate aminotransferase
MSEVIHNPEPGVRLRAALDAVPAYKPGKPATEREGITAYKMSSNENPYPPLPSVLEVVRDAAGTMNRYPDMSVAGLTATLATSLGVPAGDIATGTGSVAVLAQMLQVTCEPGDEVVYAWRSFEAYPIVVALSGATSVQVPLDADARHDLDAMAAAITDRTRLVLVCTPNNPTGPAVHADELDAFLAKVPPDVLVVIDEAYLEFGRDDEAPDALALYRTHPNVAVLRTFSKAYGLAGLRVGYAVAQEPVATALRKAALPFGVSDLAQRAAVASIAAFDELQERVDALVLERERVRKDLLDQGWQVPDSQANFVWLPLGEDTAAFAAAADQAGLTVRPFPSEGCRCTIAETEANDRLLEVAEAFRRA